MKKVFIMLLLLPLFFSSVCFAERVVADRIVATVEGQPITAYELENIAGFYKAKNAKELINRVINDYVIMYYAKKMGIVVTDEDVDRYIDNLARRNNLSPDVFLEKVKGSGIDLSYYREGIKLGLYRKKFTIRMFAPTIRITKTDIERYYKLHKNEIKTNPVLVMSVISLKDKNLAEKIYQKLKNGGDFLVLKKQFSLDKVPSRTIPLSAFNKQIRSVLAKLKVGEFSNIIESNHVYYIVKILDRKGDSSDLNTLKNRIREIIFTKKVESKLSSWIKMVKSRTDIEIFG